MKHFEMARDRVLMGQRRDSMALSDDEKEAIAYHEAGHAVCAAVLEHADPVHKVTILPTGMALGVEAEAAYTQRTLTLGPGDFVLLYTDGVTDALNAQGEEFGAQRLRDAAAAHRDAPAASLLAGLEQALADFTGAAAPFDDLTLLVARRL